MVLEYGLKYRDLERLKATLPTITEAIPISLITQTAAREALQIPNARILGNATHRRGQGRSQRNVWFL